MRAIFVQLYHLSLFPGSPLPANCSRRSHQITYILINNEIQSKKRNVFCFMINLVISIYIFMLETRHVAPETCHIRNMLCSPVFQFRTVNLTVWSTVHVRNSSGTRVQPNSIFIGSIERPRRGLPKSISLKFWIVVFVELSPFSRLGGFWLRQPNLTLWPSPRAT